MYTYETYLSTDTHMERYNIARTELLGESKDAYIISENGEPFMIQFGLVGDTTGHPRFPFPGATLEECAQNHIAVLAAEQPQERQP